MELEQAIDLINTALVAQEGKSLTDTEVAIVTGAWQGQTYSAIATASGYTLSYLSTDIGPVFWRRLSQALGEKVSKTNFRSAIERYGRQEEKMKDEGARMKANHPFPHSLIVPFTHADWGEAIDVSLFYGRTKELHKLQQWAVADRVRLIAVLGMGGIGKTSLAVKLAQQIEPQFEYVIWRSLRNAPPLDILLNELISFLSNQEDTQATVGRLLHWLRNHRCLVILDNLETILQPGDRAGQYREGFENYGDLLRTVGETGHQSCLILTSREKPAEIAALEGIDFPVRSLQLAGSAEVSQAMLQAKGLTGTDQEQQVLCDRYGRNPLALKIISSSIQDLFDGEIAPFIEQNIFVFNGINRLLEQQLERLTYLEKSILYWLTINREWTSISELLEDIVPPVSYASLLEALESLSWRNLIEKRSGSYTLQPVVMEYVTGCLVERVSTELVTGKLVLGDRHALIKTTVKDYVRDSQIRLILQPIAEQFHLAQKAGSKNPSKPQTSSLSTLLQQKIVDHLQALRRTETHFSGYGAGNLINLCLQLDLDLSGVDFSNLNIWHAYLQGATLHDTQFQGVQFAKAVFTETLGSILAVDYHPHNEQLATGDSNGDIWIWGTSDGQPIAHLSDHNSWVWMVTYSPDGRRLASGSSDQTLRVWDISSGRCLWVSTDHDSWVLSATWSPDGAYLASTGQDATLCIWDSKTGTCLKRIAMAEAEMSWGAAWHPFLPLLTTANNSGQIMVWNTNSWECVAILKGHENWVTSVAWHPEGGWLASGSSDYTVKVWDWEQRTCLATLPHDSNVWTVKWNPSGTILASACHDHTARLWDVTTHTCLKTLQGHSNWLWDIAWNKEGTRLVSASHDQTLMLWDVQTGQRLRTFQGYSNNSWSIIWSQDGTTLYAGSTDHSIKIWDIATGQVARSLKGHSNWVWGIALSPDQRYLASGSVDRTIRLWDLETFECVQILREHQNTIWCVAWHPQKTHLLATGSHDQTIRLWDTRTGQCLRVMEGHTHFVDAIAWSPDGTYLSSSSTDCTLRLWHPDSGECLQVFQVEQIPLYANAWHPDGTTLIGGYYDARIRFWDIKTGRCTQVLEGHYSNIWTLAWNSDGTLLASGGVDQTVKVWLRASGQCIHTFVGHQNWINAVAWHPCGTILASSSEDKTIRLWDTKTGECLQVLSNIHPYEGMNVTRVQGLTNAQIATLKALGATER